MRLILFLFLGALAAAFLPILAGRLFREWKYKIRSERGIQKAGYVRIGGIEQYIQMRGQDIANPVILMLHGGPGAHMAFYSYYWQTPLEDRYTIVHYDQRGCGNTYYHNLGAAEKPTLELLLSDLDEVIEYIRREYGKDKVILAGHSWGSFMGSIYASAHPEKVAAYIGVGQEVDFLEAEKVAAEEASRLAIAAGKDGHAQRIGEMYQKIRSNSKFERSEFAAFMKLRKLTGAYLPHGHSIKVHVGLFSPYVTLHEARWFLGALFHAKPFFESHSHLYQMLFSGENASIYAYPTCYEMPMLFIAGRYDWVTPSALVQAYMRDVSAPEKEFLWIDNAGHAPFMDQPAAFAAAIRDGLDRALGEPGRDAKPELLCYNIIDNLC